MSVQKLFPAVSGGHPELLIAAFHTGRLGQRSSGICYVVNVEIRYRQTP